MATGLVDNWLNIDTFGPIYPFVGTEGILAFVGIAFWLLWHVIQIMREIREFNGDLENIRTKGGVDQVLAEEAEREQKDAMGR